MVASVGSAQSALTILLQGQSVLDLAPTRAPTPRTAGGVAASSGKGAADDGASGPPEPPSRDPLGNFIDLVT